MRVNRKQAALATAFTTCGLASFHAALYLMKLRVPIGAYPVFLIGAGFIIASVNMYQKACRNTRPDSPTSEGGISRDDEQPEGLELQVNPLADDLHEDLQVAVVNEQDQVADDEALENEQVQDPVHEPAPEAEQVEVVGDLGDPPLQRHRSGCRSL